MDSVEVLVLGISEDNHIWDIEGGEYEWSLDEADKEADEAEFY